MKDNIHLANYCTMKSSIERCNIGLESNRVGKLGEHEYMVNNRRMYRKFPTLAELHETLFGNIPAGLHDSMIDVEICLKCYRNLLQVQEPTDSKAIAPYGQEATKSLLTLWGLSL